MPICDECGEDRDDVEEIEVYGDPDFNFRELCSECAPDEDTSDLKTDESDGGYV